MRLGFAVSVLGRPRLRSYDGRRWPNGPHLSVSLLYLRDILEYLRQQDIRMYRLSPQLAPYAAHPALPQFANQLDECAGELAYFGQLAANYGMRLSIHATPYTILSAPEPALAAKSAADLIVWARLLDRLGQGPEAVIVLHLGGAYGDAPAAKSRFLARCRALPAETLARLALENDDGVFGLADVLEIAGQIGRPVVFDYLHFLNYNPEGWSLREGLARVWASWPAGVRPKLHFSSPRTDWHAGPAPALTPPQWTEHSDFVNPFEFIALARQLPAGAPADIMLEARAKDVALLRLRADLHRYAPDLTGRFE